MNNVCSINKILSHILVVSSFFISSLKKALIPSFFFSSCDWRRSTNWPNIHFIFVFVCHLVDIILTCNKLTIRLKFKRKLIMKNKLFTKYLIKKSRFLSYLIVCNSFVLLANPIHLHLFFFSSSFCLNWLIDSIYLVYLIWFWYSIEMYLKSILWAFGLYVLFFLNQCSQTVHICSCLLVETSARWSNIQLHLFISIIYLFNL